MTSMGVHPSVRWAICSSLVAIAAIAVGRPAIGRPEIGHPAIGSSASRSVAQATSNFQQLSTLRAQASPPVQPHTVPNTSESSTQGEPEREIEFTSPTFSIGVQGEGIQGEGSQGNGGPGTPTQGETAQDPFEAAAQRDAGLSDEAANEALAAQHDWVEFSVEDSDEAIARYGCDDLYCINALREQRGLPPLQLVWDAQNSNTSPQ